MSVVDLRSAFPIPEAASSDVDPDRQLVGVSDVAEMTGMSEKWVYAKFTAEVPPMKFGGRNRWYRWQVYAYIDAKHQQGVR